GKCCTRAFNGHVLLLEEDAERVRSIDPESLEPPPLYDFCDQHGVFYVSGYTLRAQPGSRGVCHFLENGRCRIYQARPWVCRLYPYMLHREPDEHGVVDWRQISGLDQHGTYHSPLPDGMAEETARDVKAFECVVLDHEIAFLAYTGGYFREHGLRHVRKRFDDGMRAIRRGATATVRVYHHGCFESWSVQGDHSIRTE
ncbi:MAG: YkgJ family cysteine cluster protein, partial [Methanolinea sp.]|nr:YkgJ family cysteine cluster protein [Methanolinea sp.]